MLAERLKMQTYCLRVAASKRPAETLLRASSEIVGDGGLRQQPSTSRGIVR